MSIPTVVWTWVLYSFGSPADCFLQWIPTYNVSAATLFPVLWSRKGTYNSIIIPVLPKSLHLWMLEVVPTSMQRWWSMKSTDFRCGCLLNPCCSFKDPGWLGKPAARGTSLTNSPNSAVSLTSYNQWLMSQMLPKETNSSPLGWPGSVIVQIGCSRLVSEQGIPTTGNRSNFAFIAHWNWGNWINSGAPF